MSEEKSDSTTSVNRVVLLPCPCCGSNAELESDQDDYGAMHQIECTGCGLALMSGVSAKVITNAWNSRVELALHNALSTIEYFVDHEIDAMEESGQWSMHAINALLYLQSAVDTKLKEIGKSGQ